VQIQHPFLSRSEQSRVSKPEFELLVAILSPTTSVAAASKLFDDCAQPGRSSMSAARVNHVLCKYKLLTLAGKPVQRPAVSDAASASLAPSRSVARLMPLSAAAAVVVLVVSEIGSIRGDVDDGVAAAAILLATDAAGYPARRRQ
jgi:hypothetical protein